MPPDPEELSDEELALYGITKFSGGGGYATTGAIHVAPITPEGEGI